MSTPVLSVRNLDIAFLREWGVEQVVDGISFDLAEREILGLVGESGCGKSVTANALMGLFPPSTTQTRAHSLQLAGREISKLPESEWRRLRGNDMAMIFQEPATALDPVFTIGQQICNVLRRHRKLSRHAAREAALQALQDCAFPSPEQVFSAYPHQLSGGMRQLCMIAMAVAMRPRVLIADEPTTALDVTTQALVLTQLKRLRDEYGTSILLVTHDLAVVAQLCQRAMVMYCGRLVEQADYARLFSTPRHPYTAGLFASVPRIGQRRPVQAIPGRIPMASERGEGCHFAARCPRSKDICFAQFPPTSTLEDTRVACHFPL